MFHRISRLILAQQNGRLIRLQKEWRSARQLLTGTVKLVYSRAILAGSLPLVANAKFEFPVGGYGLDGIDRCREIVDVDPINDGGKLLCACHVCPQFFV